MPDSFSRHFEGRAFLNLYGFTKTAKKTQTATKKELKPRESWVQTTGSPNNGFRDSPVVVALPVFYDLALMKYQYWGIQDLVASSSKERRGSETFLESSQALLGDFLSSEFWNLPKEGRNLLY